MNAQLTRLYYDVQSPAGFSSVKKLKDGAKGKYSYEQIKDWLAAQNTYTLHKSRKKSFKRNKFFVTNIDEIWQADLNDMRSMKSYNNNFNYLLTVIDTFSKFAWAVPLFSKNGSEISNAFKKIIKESGRKPIKINTDKGKEFLNKTFQDFLRVNNIKFYTTNNPDIKASIVERFNQTLKSKMFKFLHYKNTKRYVDALAHLLESYNNSVHSTTKYAPSKINEKNILEVWRNIYKDHEFISNKTPKFKIGDKVRISREKNIFEKGYVGNFSEEIFTIHNILMRNPIVYTIKDYNSELITGTFYEDELQKVILNDESLFKVDKILDTRGKGNSRVHLVRWLGYPSKFDSWVRASDLVSI